MAPIGNPQTLIDSGTYVVKIPKGEYYPYEPIQLRSNMILEFQPGTLIEAGKLAFQGLTDCLISTDAAPVSNVRLVLNGCTLRMLKADYAQAPYTQSEFRHILNIVGAQDILVEADGAIFENAGGDGLYIGVRVDGGIRYACRNVRIVGPLTLKNAYRNGMSFTSGTKVRLEKVTAQDTIGTSPQAGFCVEPNNAADPIELEAVDCNAFNNRGGAYDIVAANINTASLFRTVFTNCLCGPTKKDMMLVRFNSVLAANGFFNANIPQNFLFQWDTFQLAKGSLP